MFLVCGGLVFFWLLEVGVCCCGLCWCGALVVGVRVSVGWIIWVVCFFIVFVAVVLKHLSIIIYVFRRHRFSNGWCIVRVVRCRVFFFSHVLSYVASNVCDDLLLFCVDNPNFEVAVLRMNCAPMCRMIWCLDLPQHVGNAWFAFPIRNWEIHVASVFWRQRCLHNWSQMLRLWLHMVQAKQRKTVCPCVDASFKPNRTAWLQWGQTQQTKTMAWQMLKQRNSLQIKMLITKHTYCCKKTNDNTSMETKRDEFEKKCET